jgi:hypothetical protein
VRGKGAGRGKTLLTFDFNVAPSRFEAAPPPPLLCQWAPGVSYDAPPKVGGSRPEADQTRTRLFPTRDHWQSRSRVTSSLPKASLRRLKFLTGFCSPRLTV